MLDLNRVDRLCQNQHVVLLYRSVFSVLSSGIPSGPCMRSVPGEGYCLPVLKCHMVQRPSVGVQHQFLLEGLIRLEIFVDLLLHL